MSEDEEVWGTFSVADHLRRRPFVGDVLLYDMLVVPVPDGDPEIQRWEKLRRRPRLQAELLAIVGDKALPVGWSSSHNEQWASRYAQLQAAANPSAIQALVRDDVAQAVSFDAKNVAAMRQGRPPRPDLDDPAFGVTRMVLADQFGSARDRSLVGRIPTTSNVESVVAYPTFRQFQSERGVLLPATDDGQTVYTFGWRFFVPADSARSDQDLLREAVELANTDEVKEWRRAVKRWRRKSMLRGQSDAEALKDMEEMLKAYESEARKRKILVATRYGSAVAAAAAGAFAVAFPPVGIAAAAFGLGTLLPQHSIPKRLEAAAMFYEARKRFR